MTGWELVCITSVLLIGFFQERRSRSRARSGFWSPTACATSASSPARSCFITRPEQHPSARCLMAHGQTKRCPWAETVATLIGLLFLLAAMGKSAQAPFSGWLPRAMEGPTLRAPSSTERFRSTPARISFCAHSRFSKLPRCRRRCNRHRRLERDSRNFGGSRVRRRQDLSRLLLDITARIDLRRNRLGLVLAGSGAYLRACSSPDLAAFESAIGAARISRGSRRRRRTPRGDGKAL